MPTRDGYGSIFPILTQGTEQFVENGTHEIYVNAAVDDGSAIAELMQYFLNSSGYHENFKAVCNRVNYLKEQNKGVNSMSAVIEAYAKQYHEEQMQKPGVIERYAQEYAKQYHEEQMQKSGVIERYAQEYVQTRDREGAIRLLNKGVATDIVAEAFPSLSKDTIQQLKAELELHVVV